MESELHAAILEYFESRGLARSRDALSHECCTSAELKCKDLLVKKWQAATQLQALVCSLELQFSRREKQLKALWDSVYLNAPLSFTRTSNRHFGVDRNAFDGAVLFDASSTIPIYAAVHQNCLAVMRRDGAVVWTEYDESKLITCIKIGEAGQNLIVGLADGAVVYYDDIFEPQNKWSLRLPDGDIATGAVCVRQRIIAMTNTMKFAIISLKTRSLMKMFHVGSKLTSWTANGEAGFIVGGTESGSLLYWRWLNPSTVPDVEVKAHERRIDAIAACGSMIVSGGRDTTLKVWQLSEAVKSGSARSLPTQPHKVLDNHAHWVTSIVSASDTCVSFSDDGSVCCWNPDWTLRASFQLKPCSRGWADYKSHTLYVQDANGTIHQYISNATMTTTADDQESKPQCAKKLMEEVSTRLPSPREVDQASPRADSDASVNAKQPFASVPPLLESRPPSLVALDAASIEKGEAQKESPRAIPQPTYPVPLGDVPQAFEAPSLQAEELSSEDSLEVMKSFIAAHRPGDSSVKSLISRFSIQSNGDDKLTHSDARQVQASQLHDPKLSESDRSSVSRHKNQSSGDPMTRADTRASAEQRDRKRVKETPDPSKGEFTTLECRDPAPTPSRDVAKPRAREPVTDRPKAMTSVGSSSPHGHEQVLPRHKDPRTAAQASSTRPMRKEPVSTSTSESGSARVTDATFAKPREQVVARHRDSATARHRDPPTSCPRDPATSRLKEPATMRPREAVTARPNADLSARVASSSNRRMSIQTPSTARAGDSRRLSITSSAKELSQSKSQAALSTMRSKPEASDLQKGIRHLGVTERLELELEMSKGRGGAVAARKPYQTTPRLPMAGLSSVRQPVNSSKKADLMTVDPNVERLLNGFR